MAKEADLLGEPTLAYRTPRRSADSGRRKHADTA